MEKSNIPTEVKNEGSQRHPTLRFLISAMRVIFVVVILIGGLLFASLFVDVSDGKTIFILIYGPMFTTGIYWVTRGQHSTIAHKLYGFIFYYLFFTLSYVLQMVVYAIVDSKQIILLAVFFSVSFLFLPFFEDRALEFITGHITLPKIAAQIAYWFTIPICALTAFLGIHLTDIIQKTMRNPRSTSIVAYLIVLIMGFLASWVYRKYKAGVLYSQQDKSNNI
jgi:hypothetical protein